ncbi:MAG: hypothetical protein WBW33_06410 [Bryobacteraceae bacterium]
MTKRLSIAFLMILPMLQAQDVPPPPKPKNALPDLVETMKSLEAQLRSPGWVS